MTVRKGLGRGLESLFAMYDEEVEQASAKTTAKSNRDSVDMIDINVIKTNPNQPRKVFDENALNELSSSIKLHGVIQPIVINDNGDGTYLIIAGERRYRAAKKAGLDKIPAVIKNYSDRQIKEIAIIENLQREDLNPIEAARAIKQLMEEYKLTQETVAERIGKSRPNIANVLRLLTLYPDVMTMVEEGKLSAGHARALVVVEDHMLQLKLANQAVKDKWTVRDLEKAVKKLQHPVTITKFQPNQSIELRELIQTMQRVLGTKVSAIGNDTKGRIYIDYYNRDDLDRIADMITLLQTKR